MKGTAAAVQVTPRALQAAVAQCNISPWACSVAQAAAQVQPGHPVA